MDDNRIKVYLTKISNGVETVVVEPTTIYNLNKYVLIDDIIGSSNVGSSKYNIHPVLTLHLI